MTMLDCLVPFHSQRKYFIIKNHFSKKAFLRNEREGKLYPLGWPTLISSGKDMKLAQDTNSYSTRRRNK